MREFLLRGGGGGGAWGGGVVIYRSLNAHGNPLSS